MPKLRPYIGSEQVSQVHHTDSHRSHHDLDIKAKDGYSVSHTEERASEAQATSKQSFHKLYINLNNSFKGEHANIH